MTRVEYLRLSALLPIVAPAVFLPIEVVADVAGVALPGWFEYVSGLTFNAAFMFGIPYTALMGMIILLLSLSHVSWKAHIAAAVAAPPLMIGTVGVFLQFLGATSDLRYYLLELLPFCLGLGYSYVALALLGLWVLARSGCLEPEHVT